MGRPAIEPEQPAVKRKQSGIIAQIDNRRSAACNRDCQDSIGNFPRRGVGVRRSARDRQNAKLLNPQMIRQLLNDLGPIDQFAIRLKTGIANAGAIS